MSSISAVTVASPADSATPLPAELRDKTGHPFVVRLLGAGDRAALDAFYEEFEPKRAAQGLPPGSRAGIDRWLGSILPVGIHLVAVSGGKLIGHAFLVPMNRPGSAEYAVFLRRDMRGRGVGTALNRIALEAAREHGFERVWLSVEPRNRAAIRSYEKAGFRFRPGTIYSPEAEMEVELEEC